MDIKKAFGETLKQCRSNREISQEKYALQIGMDRTYYASVEAGKRNISIQNIQKIFCIKSITCIVVCSCLMAFTVSPCKHTDSCRKAGWIRGIRITKIDPALSPFIQKRHCV